MASESVCTLRRVSLAISLAAALGLDAAPRLARATTWPVGRCSDTVGKGGDTLRVAVSKAGSNDIVDLSTLPATCSGFTLTGGAIPVGVTTLSIVSPRNITIDGGYNGRIFNHTGSGILYLRYLTLTHGSVASGLGDGGCVVSGGEITLSHTTITGCQAAQFGGGAHAQSCLVVYSAVDANLAPQHAGLYCDGAAAIVHSSVSGNLVGGGLGAASVEAYYSTFANNTRNNGSGGAIHANGTVKLVDSTISGNAAGVLMDGSGGGISAGGNVTVQGSSITGNSASASGGGISTPQNLDLTDTTVSGNHAVDDGGGARTHFITLIRSTLDSNTATGGAGGADSNGATITNSTISGNRASHVGGLYGGTIHAYNSTVAFNVGTGSTADSAGGLVGNSISMSSTIVAKNSRATAGAADVYVNGPGAFLPGNSLIMSCNRTTLSISADPKLTPLALHGGSMRTHGLSIGSPAIDAGNAGGLTTDQRGSGYPRVAGSAADIGAFERQAGDDELFYSGFE